MPHLALRPLLVLTAALAGAASAVAAEPAPIKPVWLQQPTVKDIMRAYPVEALNHSAPGVVVIGCRVAADGTLGGCRVEEQKPLRFPFGVAALMLVTHYRMAATDEDGRPTAGATVRIPVQFKIVG
jgi:TonB family protein